MKNKNAVNLGKLGGKATSKKLGVEHYRELAQHMNEVKKSKKL
jgi:hypothetical protein